MGIGSLLWKKNLWPNLGTSLSNIKQSSVLYCDAGQSHARIHSRTETNAMGRVNIFTVDRCVHWVKAGWHHGWVASLPQGHKETWVTPSSVFSFELHCKRLNFGTGDLFFCCCCFLIGISIRLFIMNRMWCSLRMMEVEVKCRLCTATLVARKWNYTCKSVP